MNPKHQETVVIQNLSYVFGEGEQATTALRDVSLTLEPGMLVVLTGPSGSGKTTLLTLIGGLRSAHSGQVRVLGHQMLGLDAAGLVAVRRDIGFIFQLHNLLEALTGLENVQVVARMAYPDPREALERSIEALTRVDLADRMDHKPRALSGGERQRVAIARALVSRPKLILADEPTAALDAEVGRHVIQQLRKAAQEDGTTVLIVTHDRRVINEADRLIHMADGRIVSDLLIQHSLEICMFLKTCDFATDLSLSLLTSLSEKIQIVDMTDGQVIIQKDQMVEIFHLIREGTVEIFADAGDSPIAVVGEGKTFGEAALLLSEPSTIRAVAKGPVKLYTIRGADYNATLDAALSQREELMNVFMTRGTQR